jgi:dUTP pyrophosphatase
MIQFHVTGDYTPEVATDGSAGLDLYVDRVDTAFNKYYTGVQVAIPAGYVGLLLPRSSWGAKGFRLANTCGVIDSDYRGEIIMVRDNNPMAGHLKVSPGDKVAQLIVVPCLQEWRQVGLRDDLGETARGDGGFGSTDCPTPDKCDPNGECC